MSAPQAVRVALVGFTGTGKSTIAAGLIDELRRRGQQAQLVKLAAPLYRLQQIYYREAGVSLAPGVQDQELMAEIAARLRKITPDALLKQFLATLAATPPETATVNDDLRVPDPDATGLRSAGFWLIRLECPDDIRRARLADRHDRSTIDEPTIFGHAMSQIPTDLTLNTHLTTPTEAVHHVLDHFREPPHSGHGGDRPCLTMTVPRSWSSDRLSGDSTTRGTQTNQSSPSRWPAATLSWTTRSS